MNKKNRFEYHLGDLMLVLLFYVIILIVLNEVLVVERKTEFNITIYCLVYFLYFFLLEAIYGTSLLKFNYARVVDMNGNKPGIFVIFLRTLFRFIPFDSFSFLVFKRGRGLHDLLSGTQVVRSYRALIDKK